ncbi:MAG: cyclopropane-fatty-acyl-phospholipid synthase family protein [Pirellulaceae bacterium]
MIVNAQQEWKSTSAFQRWCRAQLVAKAKVLPQGCVRLIDANGVWNLGEAASWPQQHESSMSAPDQLLKPIELHIRDPRFYSRMVMGGNLGAAESWMDGDWTCDRLPELIELLVSQPKLLDRYENGAAKLRQVAERIGHWLRRNTRCNSRTNISQHYDLGNTFFELFLDPTMNYSSAVFDELPQYPPRESLHRAQLRKMKRLCDTLQLGPNDHLLEIGTGWGSLACFAAKHYGCRVTTTTISREQFEWARRRVENEGLTDRVTVLEQDYRDLDGQYDKIVSVEMIEAVGDQFYDTFFKKCNRLLRPEGIMLLQAITIVDERYRHHVKNVDFICKHIFPGGSLPCISRLTQAAAMSSSMRVVKLDDYAEHYTETLRRWRERFWDKIESVRSQGYDERFIRMWDYYLAYCQAGFQARQINLVHMLFAKHSSRYDITRSTTSDWPQVDSLPNSAGDNNATNAHTTATRGSQPC